MPTAFITYSHDNEAHCTKALDLANRLRDGGIDVSIDAYEPHPVEGWPKWMERQFRQDFRIIILSPRYIRDFNQAVPNHSGARYEGAIVSSLLFDGGVTYDKMAIVCFDTCLNLDVPPILAGCTRYCVDQPYGYDKLYALLSGQALVSKPPLGKIVPLRPSLRALPSPKELSFAELCRALRPLMDENKRIFEHFGPNSGAAKSGEPERTVRYDLALWGQQRLVIGENNQIIADRVLASMEVIPDDHLDTFRRLLSHIDAFAQHLADESVDYRDHQFPRNVYDIVRSER